MCELISKHPENVWSQFYHMEVDGQIHYVYEAHIYRGYGMACNTPSECLYLLIDQEMYESEQSDIRSGPLLYRTDLFDSARINEGVAQGIRHLMAYRAQGNNTAT